MLKRFVGKLLTKKVVVIMLDGLKGKLEGKKTYVTAVLGLIVAAVGALVGPVDLPMGLHIPNVSPNELVKIAWEAALVCFVRNGVAKIGN